MSALYSTSLDQGNTPVALAEALLLSALPKEPRGETSGVVEAFTVAFLSALTSLDLKGERGKSLTKTAGSLNVAGLLFILHIVACPLKKCYRSN